MEEIARRRPVDRTAARVTSTGPKGLGSRKVIAQVCSPTPVPLRPVPRDMINLVGRSFGHLVVAGLCAKRQDQGKWAATVWLCRCVCGYYVVRTTKAINNPANAAVDRCDRCRQTEFLRRRSTYQQTGL